MKGVAHISTGIAAAFAVSECYAIANNYSIKENLLLVTIGTIISGVGSALPDIDLPSSLVGRIPIINLFSKCINKLFGHRTITHSGLWLVLYFFALFYKKHFLPSGSVEWWFVFFMGLGFISHIIADTFTNKGVPWLYPIIKYKFHLTKFKSGKKDILFGISSFIISSLLGIWLLSCIYQLSLPAY